MVQARGGPQSLPALTVRPSGPLRHGRARTTQLCRQLALLGQQVGLYSLFFYLGYILLDSSSMSLAGLLLSIQSKCWCPL